ncbi:hypothetical protein LXL04_013742 [Taraxacum kok-saghyz]
MGKLKIFQNQKHSKTAKSETLQNRYTTRHSLPSNLIVGTRQNQSMPSTENQSLPSKMATNEGVIDVDDQNGDGVEAPDKMRSIVWQHFPYKKGAQTSKCNHCKKVIACGTRMSTSGLLNHLRNTCKTSGLYKEHKNDPEKQSTLNFKPKDTEGDGSLAKHSFSQENCRLKLAKMCIKDNQLFSVVDDEGFQDYNIRPSIFVYPQVFFSSGKVVNEAWSVSDVKPP